MKVCHLYPQVISIENLFQAWSEFKKGKIGKKDVQIFEMNLEDNLFWLHNQLENKKYKHCPYTAFNIYDPKFRHIHKATVPDRIVHHALVSIIAPIFDKTFIYDSYSCRKNKGMHKAVKRLFIFIKKVSRNYNDKCFILKMDIKKFFASVDHEILLESIKKKTEDEDLFWLIVNILKSFSVSNGIPIGNLTSQIFANIYLNQLDKFIKQHLRIKYYIRYADDFVIVSDDQEFITSLIPIINQFLKVNLKLSLHQDKMIIKKYRQGVDFLGYIVLPHYILPRTKTTKRMFKKLAEKKHLDNFNQTLASYLGYLSHASTYKLQRKIISQYALYNDN